MDDRTLDMRRLIGKVAERHGIRIDFSDPAFYVLSLNELALEEASKSLLDGIRKAISDFEHAAETVQNRAGTILAQRLNEAAGAARLQLDEEIGQVVLAATERLDNLHEAQTRFARHWLAAGIVSAFMIFLIGLLVGLWMR